MSSPSHALGPETAFWYAASHVSKAVVSCRFRIGHFSELMPGANVVVGPTFPAALAERIRTVICVRPYVGDAMRATLEQLGARGVRRIADFDDLLFDGSPAAFPSVIQGRSNPNIVAARIGIYRRGLESFDAFTATTPSLAEHLRALVPTNRPVVVVPNGLSRAWVRAGRAAARGYREGDRRVIRYFAGSPTHDADLAMIAPELARFLDAHEDASLELAGHFDTVPDALAGRAVTLTPIRPYMLLPMLLAPSYVSLAPLVDTAFSRCKSDVKFLESGAFGVPTLASDSVVYRHHDGHGLIACRTPRDWTDALESIWDPRGRAEASESALARVEQRGFAHLGALRKAIGSEAEP